MKAINDYSKRRNRNVSNENDRRRVSYSTIQPIMTCENKRMTENDILASNVK